MHDIKSTRDCQFFRREGRSDSIVELSKSAPTPACDGKESQPLDDNNNSNNNNNANINININQNHRSMYSRDSCSRSNSNSNSNSNNTSPLPVQRKRNSTLTSDNHQTSGNISSGLNPQHACMTSLYHPPHTHTTDDLQNDYMSDEVQSLWIQFMDGVALLQAADVSHLNPASDDALCMYLNLYHLMVIHSCLVIGPPCSAYKVPTIHSTAPHSTVLYCTALHHTLIDVISYYFLISSPFFPFSSSFLLITSLQWVGFFGCVSYEVFGDFISIAELEHCILRNGECWQTLFLMSLCC